MDDQPPPPRCDSLLSTLRLFRFSRDTLRGHERCFVTRKSQVIPSVTARMYEDGAEVVLDDGTVVPFVSDSTSWCRDVIEYLLSDDTRLPRHRVFAGPRPAHPEDYDTYVGATADATPAPRGLPSGDRSNDGLDDEDDATDGHATTPPILSGTGAEFLAHWVTVALDRLGASSRSLTVATDGVILCGKFCAVTDAQWAVSSRSSDLHSARDVMLAMRMSSKFLADLALQAAESARGDVADAHVESKDALRKNPSLTWSLEAYISHASSSEYRWLVPITAACGGFGSSGNPNLGAAGHQKTCCAVPLFHRGVGTQRAVDVVFPESAARSDVASAALVAAIEKRLFGAIESPEDDASSYVQPDVRPAPAPTSFPVSDAEPKSIAALLRAQLCASRYVSCSCGLASASTASRRHRAAAVVECLAMDIIASDAAHPIYVTGAALILCDAPAPTAASIAGDSEVLAHSENTVVASSCGWYFHYDNFAAAQQEDNGDEDNDDAVERFLPRATELECYRLLQNAATFRALTSTGPSEGLPEHAALIARTEAQRLVVARDSADLHAVPAAEINGFRGLPLELQHFQDFAFTAEVAEKLAKLFP